MDFGGPSWLQPIATVGILAALYLFFSQRRRRAEPQLARGNPPRPRSSAEGSAHQPPGAASFPSHDGGVIKTSVILDAAARKGEGAKETARREGSAARREDMQARAAAAAEARAAPRRPPPAPPSACRGEDVSTRKGGSSPIVGDTQPKDSQAPGEQGGAKHAADAEKRLSVAKASGVLSSLSGMSEDSVSSLAPTLRVLSLEDQSLPLIPLLALPLPSLTRAALAGNLLPSLPSLHLPRVEKLDVSHNCLSSLPDGCWDAMRHLKELRLTHNRLAALPPSLSRAPALRALYASHNLLTSLGPDIAPGDFGELTDLDVSINSLEVLPGGMECMRSLKRLNVEGNRLQGLPEGLLEGTRVEKIVARGNPLSLKEQKGFDAYLDRMRRRVVEDGNVYEFSHKEVAHQREKERRIAAGDI